MAEIRPFRALRFTQSAGDISELCCPPYDIISDDERKGYLEKNPHNIIRLELPREGRDYYAEAARVLKQFETEGLLKQDDQEGLYIYGEEFSVDGVKYSFKGVISLVKIEEFSKGVILPHEETLSKAKADRFALMDSTMCNFSQIYSLYNDENGETQSTIERLSAADPAACFTDRDGVTHRLWIVNDSNECDLICTQFANRKLYIADGHHRYETSLNFRNYLREEGRAVPGDKCDYVMMMLVAMESSGLVVFPTHRIVRGLEEFDSYKLIEACKSCFEIAEYSGKSGISEALKSKYDDGKKSFVLYTGNDKWYLMTLSDGSLIDELCPGCSEAYKSLDVTVLHTLVLERVLGINKENMANQVNLTYTREVAEAFDAVDNGKANCCFIMNPTRVKEISDVANAGEKMPQKSTYFYPKLITGLVMNKFGEI